MELLTNYHIPVLAEEVKNCLLQERHSGTFFDGTVGFGGHAEVLLSGLDEKAIYTGTDVDDTAFKYSTEKFLNESRFRGYQYNFTKINAVANIEGIEGYDGIIADLGVSSFQLDDASAGFTFREDAPLDMRMQKTLSKTAADIVNKYKEEELSHIFFTYGEERASRKISKFIVEQRERKAFATTGDLLEIIRKVAPVPYINKTAQRVFQALRIAVNDELENLKIFLDRAIPLLNRGGRIAVISFHSLEDRIVKDVFKYEEKSCVCAPGIPICVCGKVQRLKVITKKPVTASGAELKINRRSRSAKLRVAERI